MIVAVILAAALIAGYMLWFRDSSLVAVEKVSVTGANLSPDVEAHLSDAAIGLSTLHLDRSALDAAVADDPALINRDPEGEGWFFKMTLADASELEGLMDESAYREWVKTL